MLRTKAQVDAHVSNILGGLSTQDERLKRGYHFARLYFDIREFDRAEEYLQGFLTVKHNYAPAYKLLAQTCEATGKETQKIINAYKKCFELDPTQKECLLKICRLYASLNVVTDEAKFWAEKAEKHFPNDADVFKLKVKASDMNQENSSNNNNILKNIEFYEAETAKYPKDAMRRMKLLRLYMSGGKVDEAYKLVIEAESQEMFSASYDWYKCLVEVLSEYKRCKKEEKLPSEFYECYLLALCLYTSLSIAQSPSITSATSVLWSLDQELCNLKDDSNTSMEPLKMLILELKAYYLFLCGTLMLNKAQKEQLSWRTLSDPSFACFLASMSRGSLNIKESWFTEASESKKPFLKRWHQLSCYRCSQIGHMLRKKYDDRSCGEKWLRRVQDDFFHNVGRNRICQMIYSQSESKESLDKSFLHKCLSFKSLPNLPNVSDLEEWDGEVQISHPANLALLVWICLHYYDNSGEVQPDYPFALYPWLPSGCDHLESSSPDSLSQMDVQTYLMATVKCSAQNHAEQLKYCDSNQPYLLPFSINPILCSPDQSQWWAAANRIKSIPPSMTQDAKVLENGLKTIRLIGTHGMNAELASHLAKTWAFKLSQQNDRLDSTVDFTEQDAYVEAQTLYMWKRALALIEALLNRSHLPPSKCLFEYRKTPISEVDLKKLHQEGQIFFAQHCKKANNFTEALRILKSIKSAESFYEAAEIYKELAGGDAGLGQPGDTLDEGKNDHLNQLTKAKDAYKSALELASGNMELEKKIKMGLEDVESKLLNVQNFNDYEFVSELTDDCTYFGEAKFSCTPQKASNNVKSAFMTSSTPFAKQKNRNQNDLENFEIRLGSLTHYVDQRFKNMSEDNHKLLERIAVLESKITSLEAQKVMWTMPFNHMMPPSHLQIYPGGAFKHSPETDVRMQHHLMMDKFHPVMQPGMNPMQSGMVFPGFNNPQSIPNFRHNLPMSHQDIYKSPVNNQFSGNFLPTPGLIDAEYANYRGADVHDGLLPSIDPNFFPKYSPVTTGGKSEVAAATPKSTIPVIQSMKPVASFAVKTSQSGSQAVCSNSSLAKLLTSPPTNTTPASSVVITLKQVDVKNATSTSSTPKNLFGFTSTVNQVQKIKPAPVATTDVPSSKTTANCVVATTEPKNIFGGLTFNAPPLVLKTEKVPESKGSEKVKATSNLFSNFSFGSSNSASSSPFTFSFTSNPPTSSSVDVAVSQTSAAPVDKLTETSEVDNDESVEEYEPVGEFKLVSLPIVNVVTGEEDCNKLFGERGKLYRMDYESKQWKERGVGEIKILGNRENKKSRILMRRDQVLKVCANHFITAEMQLKSMDTSENSFCWMAMDYAEEEMRKEQFCIKFKTKEIASAFKECFESRQKYLSTSEPTDSTKTDVADVLKTSSVNVKESPLSLADQFKAKDGEWSCKDCYVKNPATSTKCLSCESPKPGCEKSSSVAFQIKSESQVIFGSQGGIQKTSIETSSMANDRKSSVSLADQFKAKDGEWSCNDCYVRNPATSTKCMSCESPKPGCENSSSTAFQVKSESKVIFGSQGGFQFGQQSSGGFGNISFGNFAKGSSLQAVPSTNVVGNVAPLFGSDASSNKASLDVKNVASVPKFVFGSSQESQNNPTTSGFSFFTPVQKNDAVPVKPEDKTNGLTFSFLKSSAVKDSKVTNEPAKSEATTSIFGLQFQGFGSKLTNEQPSDSSVKEAPFADKKSISSAPFNISTPSFSFAGLTSNVEEVPTAPVTVLPTVSDVKSSVVEDELYTNVDGEDSHIQFEPIVKLPDNYEIKTFEEDETVLYENENAKIFRFHNNEWKEKGSGTVKLLSNEKTGKVRVLMRRDKIHKICCNHYIMPDMQLHPLMNNKKALVWYAHDYVDGDQELQQLCIKFKTEEHAVEFKKHFLQVVEDMKDKNISDTNGEADCVITYVEEPGSNLIEEAGRWMLPKNFYNYLNMPPCKGCIGCNEEFEFKSSEQPSTSLKTSHPLVSSSNAPSSSSSNLVFGTTLSSVTNKPALFTFDALKQSLKSNNDSATSDAKIGDALAKNGISGETIQLESKTKEMVVKDGIKSSDSGTPFSFIKGNDSFKSSPSSIPVFGSSSKTLDFGSLSKEGSGFKPDKSSTPLTFSFNTVEKTPLLSADASGAGTVFGSASNTLDFSSLSTTGTTFKSDSNFSWKGAGEKLFASTTPEKPQSATNEDQNEEDEVVEERDIHFEPIISLPEVEVTTGEEDELEIYRQRSMLYRFDGQWKERGVGEMKILKNKETGVYRLLLRREQIHKVVCNHLLSADMNFNFMESSERALCWFANDFSEEPRVEQFALKFKTIDLAKEFLKKVEECQDELRSQKH